MCYFRLNGRTQALFNSNCKKGGIGGGFHYVVPASPCVMLNAVCILQHRVRVSAGRCAFSIRCYWPLLFLVERFLCPSGRTVCAIGKVPVHDALVVLYRVWWCSYTEMISVMDFFKSRRT